MTSKLEALRALHDAVQAGEATIGALEPLAIAAFLDDAGSRSPAFMHVWSAYRGSLDAAHALHKAVLPGWHYVIHENAVRLDHLDYHEVMQVAATPARAWLLAILAALIAQEEAA